MLVTTAINQKIWHNSKHPLIADIPGATAEATKQLLIKQIFRGQKRVLLQTFPTS
jgi:hypothetical protein